MKKPLDLWGFRIRHLWNRCRRYQDEASRWPPRVTRNSEGPLNTDPGATRRPLAANTFMRPAAALAFCRVMFFFPRSDRGPRGQALVRGKQGQYLSRAAGSASIADLIARHVPAAIVMAAAANQLCPPCLPFAMCAAVFGFVSWNACAGGIGAFLGLVHISPFRSAGIAGVAGGSLLRDPFAAQA